MKRIAMQNRFLLYTMHHIVLFCRTPSSSVPHWRNRMQCSCVDILAT
ncbi:hypothetical protein BIFGAL_03110 [Bifidobacterium gallicum DSM 20093 = LMG 11596]|uniref:Uncharacterized protein n=1 Tax=Bifidobacterium gallicum DSM 20093 = LMG 11596 TaxID=561180 RepID=D1NTF2_9BIFI|nr:hypothetical protein BIFGAL_03110 [Bifidobacterium gallicum DSM 20093 = LMG 11596]